MFSFRISNSLVRLFGGLLSVFLLTGCYDETRVFLLDGDWQYRQGFEPEWLRSAPPTGWHSHQPPIRFKSIHPDYKGYRGWVTLRTTLPPELNTFAREKIRLGFDSGMISDVSYFYINGKPLGQLGSSSPYKSGTYRALRVDIPENLIRPRGENILTIALYSDGEHALDLYKTPQIGAALDLNTKHLQSELISVSLLVVYFLVGAFHLLLAARRPRETYYFYFGLACLGVTVYWSFRAGIREHIFGERIALSMAVEYCSLIGIPTLLTLFQSQFFFGRYSKFTILGAIWALGISIVICVSCWLGWMAVPIFCLTLIHQSILFYFIPVFFSFIIRPALQGNRDAFFLMGGALLLISGTIHDILVAHAFFNGAHLARYAFAAFILGIAAILVNRFVRMHEQVEELNTDLELKVEQRTLQLEESLHEIKELKVQQDGDYFLTSLLVKPLGGNFADSEDVDLEILVRQKKQFQYKKWQAEIGGDLCAAHSIRLGGRSYVAFINADAMGKSIQGAGGALVLGTVFKSVITRTQFSDETRAKSPERWIKDCFIDLQRVFVTFDGSMMISAILGLVDEQTGLLYFVNAEHPWLVLYRAGKARFIGDPQPMHKIGMSSFDKHRTVKVSTHSLQPNDVVLSGSDGRDDIEVGTDDQGYRLINEDHDLFLRQVEQAEGQLEAIHAAIQSAGSFTDDLSLIRIAYKFGQPQTRTELKSAAEDFQKGADLLKNNQAEAAVEFLQAADRKTPDHPLILRELARAADRLRKWRDAAQTWARLVSLDPADTNALFCAARAHKLNRNFDAAAEFGERVRLRAPDLVNNLINLADICRLSDRTARAFKLLDEAMRYEPNNPHALRLKDLLGERMG